MGARLTKLAVGLCSLGLLTALALAACGTGTRPKSEAPIPRALVLESRPIGRSPRFHPPATGPVLGRCSRTLGARFGVHVEVFAANRVVLIARGIGTRPPRSLSEGRISGAACFGDLVTIDPTGLVLIRPRARLTVADLFRSWGQPLSDRRLAGFTASPHGRVSAFVDGRRYSGSAQDLPLARHAEIVLEVGPQVPPHSSYTFPPGT